MSFPAIRPNPDFSRLVTVLRRGVPDQVPIVDFWLDDAVTGEPAVSNDLERRWREIVDIWLRLGFDIVPVTPQFPPEMRWRRAPSSAPGAVGLRCWRELGRGPTAT